MGRQDSDLRRSPEPPNTSLAFTVDTNGTVTAYDLGFSSAEDVDQVVTNQNLFCLNFNKFTPSSSSLLKIPQSLFGSFIDDFVFVEEFGPTLMMVHWDGVRFSTRRLSVSGASSLEHVSFAPILCQ